MQIQKFKIENFKAFRSVTLNFRAGLNLLTGRNNCGKTTVLEAVALWEECFRKQIQLADRNKPKQNVNRGDYFLGKELIVDSSEITSVRGPDTESLFHNLDTDTTKRILLEATLGHGREIFKLGFQIKYSRGNRYNIYPSHSDIDYPLFNRFFSAFPHPVRVAYASPISTLRAVEEYEMSQKITRHVRSRESMLVFRNRLDRLAQKTVQWENFQGDLFDILRVRIDFDFRSKRAQDIKAQIAAQTDRRGEFIDLSLLGSGTLQIMEILLALHEEEFDLNLVLLDEPDSHIHRDIQKKLLETLTRRSENNQILLSTHNESLIRAAPVDCILHIQNRPEGEYRSISREPQPKEKRKGLLPNPRTQLLQSLGHEEAIDYLNALEADALILVEGASDARYIEKILDKKYNNKSFNVMFWVFGSVGEIFEHIQSYRELFFETIKNDRSLWEKAVLICDKDFLPEKHRLNVINTLKKKLKIPVHIWSSYTIESTVLTEPDEFIRLLSRFFAAHDVTPSIDELKTVFHNCLDVLTKQKQKYLKEKDVDAWLGSAQEWQGRLKRAGALKTEIDVTKFKTSELPDDSLKPDDVYQVADKQDVAELVKQVGSTFGVEFLDIPGVFEQLLAQGLTQGGAWFDDWDRMVEAVERAIESKGT